MLHSLSSGASACWKYNQWLGSANNWNTSGKTWDRKARDRLKQVPSKIFPHSLWIITKSMGSCPDPGAWWKNQLCSLGLARWASSPGRQWAVRHGTLIPRTGSQAGLLLCHLSLQCTTWPQDFSVLGETPAQHFSSILGSIFSKWVSCQLFNSLNSRTLNCSLESVLWLQGSPSPIISWHRAAESPGHLSAPRLRSSCPVACFSHPHLLLPRQASFQPLPLGSFQLTWPIFYQLKTEGIETCWVTIGSVLFSSFIKPNVKTKYHLLAAPHLRDLMVHSN